MFNKKEEILDLVNRVFSSKENKEENIKNRKPQTYGELMAILIKEHEETFKDITLDAQFDKFMDEVEEYEAADNPLDEAREVADMLIVAAGVSRFAPRFAKEFMVDKIIDMIDEEAEYGRGLVTYLALEKSLINKNRDWSKKAESINISDYGRALFHKHLRREYG